MRRAIFFSWAICSATSTCSARIARSWRRRLFNRLSVAVSMESTFKSQALGIALSRARSQSSPVCCLWCSSPLFAVFESAGFLALGTALDCRVSIPSRAEVVVEEASHLHASLLLARPDQEPFKGFALALSNCRGSRLLPLRKRRASGISFLIASFTCEAIVSQQEMDADGRVRGRVE